MVCLMCWLALTLNVYTEAGGEGYKGMEMVADIVINRSNNPKFPADVKSVVLQPKQFSWTSRLKSRSDKGLLDYNEALTASKRLSKKKEKEAYIIAAKIAYKALYTGYRTKHNYIYFYSGTDKPYWSLNKTTYKYGGHYYTK